MATRIKRYEAPLDQLDALLARIEAEMGPEAELETREFRRGQFLGMFGGRRMVEIVAILDIGTLGAGSQPEAASAQATKPDEPQLAEPETVDSSPPAEAPAPAEPTVPTASNVEVQQYTPRPKVSRVDSVDLTSREDEGTVEPRTSRIDLTADEPSLSAEPSQSSKPQPQPKNTAPREDAAAEPDTDKDTPDEATVTADADISPERTEELNSLKSDISEIKSALQQLLERENQLKEQLAAAEEPPEPGSGKPLDELETAIDVTDLRQVVDPVALDKGITLPAIHRRVYDRLLEWNVGPYDAIELLNTSLEGLAQETEVSEELLLNEIFRTICRNILVSEGTKLRGAPPGKVIALVGATGVGKTTTVAKLAAHFAFQQNRRISMVSLDNYRIAAAEQLRTYADIMGLELDIVFNRSEFDEVLTERLNCDLVLVDTAGRAPTNSKQIYELREIFSAHPPDEVHLVISASTKADDLRMMLESFKPLSYDHVILSKLDETRSMGCLYNLIKYCKSPISFFTVGQSVPEDLRPATLKFVQNWIEKGRIT